MHVSSIFPHVLDSILKTDRWTDLLVMVRTIGDFLKPRL